MLSFIGKKNWEESLELFLKRLFFEKLSKRLAIENSTCVWMLIVGILLAFVRLSFLSNLFIPFSKEILDIIKELVMNLC